MRIAVAPVSLPSLPQTIHAVSQVLSAETQDDPIRLRTEATALQELVNDTEFQAAARQAMEELGKSIFSEIAPEAAELMNGNQYVALATDADNLVSLLNKGDKIDLLPKIGAFTAEVVEVLSDTLPHGRAIRIVTVIFKVSLPLVGAWHRLEAKKCNRAILETAVLEAHGTLLSSEATLINPFASPGFLQQSIHSPNLRLSHLLESHMQAS